MLVIYRGEDTDFADSAPLEVSFETDLDITGFTAEVQFGEVIKSFPAEEVQTKKLGLVYTADETSTFFPGKGIANMRIFDTEGRIRIQKRFVIDVKFRSISFRK